MEEIGAIIPEYQLLQVLWRAFTPSKLSFPARFTHYLRISTCTFSFKRISNVNPKFIEIGSASFLLQPHKILLLPLRFFTWPSFFLLYFFVFIIHFTRTCVNLDFYIQIFILYIKIDCLTTHSFLSLI